MISLKINNNIKSMMLALAVLLTFNACEEETSVYKENPYVLEGSTGLQYSPITTYAYQEKMTSAAPSFTVSNSVYNFSILTVKRNGVEMADGLSIFDIDPKTGVISIDNSSGSLLLGANYSFSIGVGNVNGVEHNDDVFQLDVLEAPLNYAIDNATYETNYLENTDVATVSYVDTSAAGNILENVSYALVNAPAGFSINSTSGVISKTTAAPSGTHLISVTIQTNVGSKTFSDVLEVTVGEAPVIQYVQADGTSPLTNVIVSPWTSYTTHVPTLDGMNAVSYEVVLPETLPAGSVTANNDGSISIAADQNLPIGTYMLGVTATNASGISADFPDLFTITVETRWEATDLFNDTFDDESTGAIDPGNTLYPEFAGYTLGVANAWTKAVISKSGLPTIRGIRVQNPGTNHHYLVRTVDITGVKAMKISFGEQSGYNDNFLVTYSRGLYVGESTLDLESGSFNQAGWTAVMPSSDSRWPGTSTWKFRVFNAIDNIDVDLSNISGNVLKIAWYIGGDSAQNGQYAIDYCNAQVSVSFPAVEE